MSVLDIVNQRRADYAAKAAARQAFYKLKPGKNRVRILPSWRKSDDEPFWHDFGQYWIKDEGGQILATVGSNLVTFQLPCPVGDVLEKAIAAAAEDVKQAAGTSDAERLEKRLLYLKEMRAKPRILVNALVRDDKEVGDKPQILDLSATQFDKFCSIMQDYGADGINILSLEEGHDIIIEKSGTGLNTEYAISPAPKASKVDAKVMDTVANLDDFVKGQFADKLPKAIQALSQITGRHVSAPAALAMGGVGGPGMKAISSPTPTPAPKAAESDALSDIEEAEIVAELEAPTATAAAPSAQATPSPQAAAPQTEAEAAPATVQGQDLDAVMKELAELGI